MGTPQRDLSHTDGSCPQATQRLVLCRAEGGDVGTGQKVEVWVKEPHEQSFS